MLAATSRLATRALNCSPMARSIPNVTPTVRVSAAMLGGCCAAEQQQPQQEAARPFADARRRGDARVPQTLRQYQARAQGQLMRIKLR